MSEFIKVIFDGKELDIEVSYYSEDEIEWSVFDVPTQHIDLLNNILHDHYDSEIESLIVDAIEELQKDNEMEAQLSNMGVNW